MRHPKAILAIITLEAAVLFLLLAGLVPQALPAVRQMEQNLLQTANSSPSDADKEYIKWVDFHVTSDAMKQAFRYDVDTCQAGIHLDWIQLLAFLGARYGGDFSNYKAKDMSALADRLLAGETMDSITADMKYYSYYLEAYTAVLGGLVGSYQVEIPASEAPAWALNQESAEALQGESTGTASDAQDDKGPQTVWVTKYGLKGFSPIAKNYPYQDYDDFGVARSYGFRRQHLGHDMMGQVGTPTIARSYILFNLICSI